MATKIQFRRDITANWVFRNPVLNQGEIGYDLTRKLFKIGDGVSPWNTLPYYTTPIAADSDWVLRQITTPSNYDSEWTASVVGGTSSYFYKTLIETLQNDSEKPIASGPDSDWVLRKLVLGGTDSEEIKAALDLIVEERLQNSYVDSDWVIRQVKKEVVAGSVDSDEIKFALDTIVDERLQNSYVDSDWVIRQVRREVVAGSIDSEEIQAALDTIVEQRLENSYVDSDWVLRKIVAGSVDSEQLNVALNTIVDNRLENAFVDSDFVINKAEEAKDFAVDLDSDMDIRVAALESKPVKADSDWILRQIVIEEVARTDADSELSARIDAIETGDIVIANQVDSEWVLSKIADPSNSPLDSEYIKSWVSKAVQNTVDSDFVLNIVADSEWVLRQIRLNRVDSDWVVRAIKRLDVDSDWIIRNFTERADSDWVLRQVRLNRLDSEWVIRTVKRLDIDSDWVLARLAASGKVDSEFILNQTYKYSKEWHVDPVNGRDSDSAYVGSQNKPFKTIGKALASAGNTGEVIYLHAGTYNETFSVSRLNLDIIGTTNGGIVNVNGTATFAHASSSIRVKCVKFNSVVHSGAGGLYLNELQVAGAVTKSGSGYFEATNCSMQGSHSITGVGFANYFSGKQTSVTVNNASAVVTIKGSENLTTANLSAGALQIQDSIVFSTGTTANAVTTVLGTTLVMRNTTCTAPTGAVARVAIAGNYSFIDVVIDRTNSTLGTSLLTNVSRFDNIAIEGTVPKSTGGFKKYLVRNAQNQVIEQDITVDSDWVIRTIKRLDVDSDWIVRTVNGARTDSEWIIRRFTEKADSDWVIRQIKRLDVDSDWIIRNFRERADSDWVIRQIKRLDVDSDWIVNQIRTTFSKRDSDLSDRISNQTLNDLKDVVITTPRSRHAIVWDSDNSIWINTTTDSIIQAYLDRVVQDGGGANQ